MKVFMTGGTGFIGTRLASFLLQRGNEVTIVGRSRERPDHIPSVVNYTAGDTTKQGKWQSLLADHDVIINLAGESIFRRWTPKNKALIYESRILTTRNLVEALPEDSDSLLLSASAVGYYGLTGDKRLVEDDGPGVGFLASLCRDWENEAVKAAEKGLRVVIARLGVVLGKGGGALKMMIPLFKFCLGGRLGSGRQWISWIHIEDLLQAIAFTIENRNISGALNFCSPNPVQQVHFAKTLARVLYRPAFARVPAILIRTALGEASSTILNGQRAIPFRLLNYGYRFQYTDLKTALHDLVREKEKK